jgi:hypothetical protein
MIALGPIAFLAPWLLAGLVALPVLWWLLRAVPPSPARRSFPGVRLLLGLQDPERQPVRTPWWLLLLRMLALAAAILAFANPVMNPRADAEGSGPYLVLLDGGWAGAPDWPGRMARAGELLDQAARAGRPAQVLLVADGPPPDGTITFGDARSAIARLPGLAPRPWVPDRQAFAGWLEGLAVEGDGFETVWIADGLATAGDDGLVAALRERGALTVIESDRPVLALTAPHFEEGAVRTEVLRTTPAALPEIAVSALGPDPQGIERKLGEARLRFEPDALVAEAEFDLPVELRNRITQVALPQAASAGAVGLADDGLKRRKVGLIAGRQAREGQDLLDPLHYLRSALAPTTDLIEAPLADVLLAAPDVIVLADVGTLAETERAPLLDWIGKGGLLVRFAGPRLAQSGDGQLADDPLLPVRLRAGGRSVGGAMSWGAPKALRPFPETSPFFGLPLPGDVAISSQVMAQPDPSLPDRVLAALEDGTPLVTGRTEGEGRVVLFHVTANADWSSLPLSGLFVAMLERLAVSTRGGAPEAGDLAGLTFVPVRVLDGFGALVEPALLTGVDGARLVEDRPGAAMPPGIWQAGDRTVALNIHRPGDVLAPLGAMPAGVLRETMGTTREVLLKPWLLLAALALLAADVLATLWVAGRLVGPVNGPRAGRQAAAGAAGTGVGTAVLLAAALLAVLAGPGPVRAQDGGDGAAAGGQSEDDLLFAANNTVLAYVATGDARVDRTSEAGLRGLSMILAMRTSIEPAMPVAVDVERDELSLYPFLYWPVTEGQPLPSEAAYGRLNAFMRNGGMVLFDTRDADLGGRSGDATPNGRRLQQIAARLDIPPLEPAPADHVLTRTFYLLQDFPGRYANSALWVEAAPEVEEVEGMPFRNLNDGVTPVVIGANDWASAWAVDQSGTPMFPVGRGAQGERQREMAFRFGVNLIMYAMTGNYKSDQVHVPALLERLGQ